jgi:hypothetical protein
LCGARSLRFFAEQRIQQPTTADVDFLPTAMLEHVGVGAAGFFEGVGQDGHSLEGAFVINALSEPWDGAAIPGEPGG